MNIVYCTSCGQKIEYTYPSPKFCSSCGSSMSEGSMGSKEKESQEIVEPEDVIPSISKLEYEIDSSTSNRIIKGSDIESVPEAPRRTIARNLNDDTDHIKEGMQLCRNSKKQTDIDG